MRIADFFDVAAQRSPAAPCLSFQDEELSFEQVRLASISVAGRLHHAGVAEGDRVIVWSGNDSLTYITYLGLQRLGAVLVPQNHKTPAEQIARLIQEFDCVALIVHPSLSDEIAKLGAAKEKLKRLMYTRKSGASDLSIETMIASPRAGFPIPAPNPSRHVRISITSGTTGKPKGILTSELSHCAMTAGLLHALSPAKPPVYLVVAPMSHVAGHLILPHLMMGAKAVFLDTAAPEKIAAAVVEHGVTCLFVPPTLLYRLLESPAVNKTSFASVERLLVGGAPVAPAKIAEAIERIGPCISHFYGQGEAPSVVSLMQPQDYYGKDGAIAEKRFASCGRETIFLRTAILGPAGEELGANEAGEVSVLGYNLMVGYLSQDGLETPVREQGWQRTGDIGLKDEDGFLYILDRKKDLIISGGFNIYPAEVEAVILAHPAVLECVVIGIPDPEWGERVTAVVELKPNQPQLDEAGLTAELEAACRAALGPVKAPKAIHYWEQIPRSQVGKVLRRVVRDHFWAGSGRSI
jgi:fatty-acyl-CoA synthase